MAFFEKHKVALLRERRRALAKQQKEDFLIGWALKQVEENLKSEEGSGSITQNNCVNVVVVKNDQVVNDLYDADTDVDCDDDE